MPDFLHGADLYAVARGAGGVILAPSDRRITGFSIDSRSIRAGDLFVAVKGENTDGHRYLKNAAEAGAAAVLINSGAAVGELSALGCGVIAVKDTVAALGALAAAHRAEYPVPLAAVTGSVGKTTTRAFIHAVLSAKYRTHCTLGNYNNELGVPLTLLGLNGTHEAAVLELGMSARGELSYLTSLVRPDIALITNIGTSHMEFLGSREGIRDAKMEIAEGLKPGGILLLNGDEPLLAGIPGAVYAALHNENADYLAGNIRFSPDGMRFDARCPGDRVITDCRICALGEHTVFDALFAVACGVISGETDGEIREGLAAFAPVGMRQRIEKKDGITYILDYYNASPESVRASLAVAKELAALGKGRTVGVIGNVLELGDASEALHREMGADAAARGVDLLFTFGRDAAFTAEEAESRGMAGRVFSFPDISDPASLADAVKALLLPGDTVLLKASHSVRMERVASRLLGKEL